MKKIIHLIPTLEGGGAETMIKDYAALTDRSKCEIIVVVWSGKKKSYVENEILATKCKVIFLQELRYEEKENLIIWNRICRKVGRYIDFRHIVQGEKPDVIHMHLRIGIYPIIIPYKKLGIKYFYTVHNVLDRYFTKKIGLNSKYLDYRVAKYLSGKDRISFIALHDGLNEEIRSYFNTDAVYTVNNGIRMERFVPELYNRNEIRGALGVRPQDYLVGNVGSFSEQKNHDMILDVFCEVTKRRPDSKLLLVGRGVERPKIEARIKTLNIEDKVIILENRDDVPALMSAMDVFLFPSKWEGFGNVLIEAQCMGLRCIISDRVPEAVRLTNLVVVRSLEDNPSEWAETLLDNTILGSPIGKLEDYDMRKSVDKLIELYEM